jgi:hypothetical protein
MWASGNNGNGQLGEEIAVSRDTPIKIELLKSQTTSKATGSTTMSVVLDSITYFI